MKVKDESKNFVFERRGNIDTYNSNGVKIKNRGFRKKSPCTVDFVTNWFQTGHDVSRRQDDESSAVGF